MRFESSSAQKPPKLNKKKHDLVAMKLLLAKILPSWVDGFETSRPLHGRPIFHLYREVSNPESSLVCWPTAEALSRGAGSARCTQLISGWSSRENGETSWGYHEDMMRIWWGYSEYRRFSPSISELAKLVHEWLGFTVGWMVEIEVDGLATYNWKAPACMKHHSLKVSFFSEFNGNLLGDE